MACIGQLGLDLLAVRHTKTTHYIEIKRKICSRVYLVWGTSFTSEGEATFCLSTSRAGFAVPQAEFENPNNPNTKHAGQYMWGA